ncbi:hypothetical protein OIE50_49695 [Streptomyces canus]|uniref:hypothetical protein n=1 Tax=Streptomyces canus TaxID=58343 RepID=UPI00324F334E
MTKDIEAPPLAGLRSLDVAPLPVAPDDTEQPALGEAAAKRRLPNCAECSQPATAAVHDGDQPAETRHLRALLTA